jgi:alpha-D-xyloside xylohydrolase
MGQQRYATITWSGDVTATWETLRRQIAEGLNFCATGCPYWTTDIGAFFVQNKPDLWFWRGDYDAGVADLGYRELYVRWFQYAAFLPLFRSHGTDTPREIWRFGEPGDPMYDALIKALRLRYRLLPYIYSLAAWTTLRGYTMLRNLAFDFREDAAAHDAAGEFMFGPAFLVAPVTEPMYYAAGSTPVTDVPRARGVYLPARTEWYDFWTGEVFAGGQEVTAAAPLDTLPLFVRAGSIVPGGPVLQHSGEAKDAPLVVHVYEGADAEFDFYDDEGDGYNYELGHYTIASLRWLDAARRLTVGPRVGSFAGMPVLRELTLVLHRRNGEMVERAPVIYDGAAMTIQF